MTNPVSKRTLRAKEKKAAEPAPSPTEPQTAAGDDDYLHPVNEDQLAELGLRCVGPAEGNNPEITQEQLAAAEAETHETKLFHLTEAVTSAERCLAECTETLKAAKANLRAFAGNGRGTGRTTVTKTPGEWKPVKASSNLGRIVAALGKGVAPKQIAADLGYVEKWGEKEGTKYVFWQCSHVLRPNHGIETEKDGEIIRLVLPPGKQVADALRS
jgi:hypothetical protein